MLVDARTRGLLRPMGSGIGFARLTTILKSLSSVHGTNGLKGAKRAQTPCLPMQGRAALVPALRWSKVATARTFAREDQVILLAGGA
ncbi:hypothetical protein JG688_00015314 [Phytophthora aleatoria]|uniref:Uncharacterized protein n=1 Tax=Phytophthora aleatoria TaxID=2496075 RepID=A0A8J5LWY3_9STRA|nr:hypothetical protein JG688_00015314 [Phytophthora aleatoria]